MQEKTQAIVLSDIGNIDKLKIKEVSLPSKMGSRDLLIKQNSIGVNYCDVHYRKGEKTIDVKQLKGSTDVILGLEGVGVIEKCGSGVKTFKVGDRVAYGFSPLGGYAKKRIIHSNFCLAVPQDVSDEQAAASIRKGLLAHALIFRASRLLEGNTIMIYGVSGGTGQIISKWCKFLGLKVIGTVHNKKKQSINSSMCDLVIDSSKSQKEIVAEVDEFTKNKGVKVIFDGIGSSVADLSLDLLAPFGLHINYGSVGGEIKSINAQKIKEKCLFFTTVDMALYKMNRMELILSAEKVFSAVKKGIISPQVSAYGIEGIKQAHKDLESRASKGSLVINLT